MMMETEKLRKFHPHQLSQWLHKCFTSTPFHSLPDVSPFTHTNRWNAFQWTSITGMLNGVSGWVKRWLEHRNYALSSPFSWLAQMARSLSCRTPFRRQWRLEFQQIKLILRSSSGSIGSIHPSLSEGWRKKHFSNFEPGRDDANVLG